MSEIVTFLNNGLMSNMSFKYIYVFFVSSKKIHFQVFPTFELDFITLGEDFICEQGLYK